MVAVSCVVVGLSDGGYSLEFRAGAALVVWWAVVIGLVLGGWPRAALPRTALAAGLCLAGLAALTLLSTVWAEDDGRAFTELVRVLAYLGLFVLVVLATPAASARGWLTGLTVGVVAVSALALGSRLAPGMFPDNELASFLPNTRSRLSFPLQYWNGLAALLALAFVALTGFGAAARTPAGRAAAVAALPVPALALFLTSSRGGVLAATIGVAVLVGLGPLRGRILMGAALGAGGGLVLAALASEGQALIDGYTESSAGRIQGHQLLLVTFAVIGVTGALRLALDPALRRNRPTRPARIGAVTLAVLVVAVATALSNPVTRFDALTKPPSTAESPASDFVASHIASAQGTGRAQYWNSGLDAFTSSPLHGIGAGGYEAWWAEHGSLSYYVRDAHSLFVEQLAELGPAGLALITAFFVLAFAAGRARRLGAQAAAPVGICLALLACGVASAALDWTWELPAAFAPVVVVAALLTGPATALAGVDQRTPGGYGWGVATLAVGWIAIVAAGIALVGEVQLGDSREAARKGDLSRAGEAASTATRIQPWSSVPRLQEALVAERRGDLGGALAANAEALDRARGDWRLWLTEARLRARTGDVRQARLALARARELNPRSPIFAGAR